MMADFDLIFENVNLKDNLKNNKEFIPKKIKEQKEKYKDATKKIKEHPKKLNYSGGEKKADMLKSNKGIVDNKEVKLFSKDKKDYIKRFLK